MKVILISEALDEPYEMDSGRQSAFDFSYAVADKVKALLETERTRDANHRHGIFQS